MSRKTALWSAAILAVAFTFIFGAVLLRSTPGTQAQTQPDVAPLVQPAAPAVDPAQDTTVMTALSPVDETQQPETDTSSDHHDKHHHDDDEGHDD